MNAETTITEYPETKTGKQSPEQVQESVSPEAVQSSNGQMPGTGLDPAKMPGHWLLARLGKRVLRPGGRRLTDQMLTNLNITGEDRVVEFAPGLGYTTRKTLARNPQFYTAIDRDPAAAARVRKLLSGSNARCLVADACDTGLPDRSASAVYGEAMLSMQPEAKKHRIVQEAFRVLAPGGRYGIHELLLTPDDITAERKADIKSDLSRAIKVGARPLTTGEWRTLLTGAGFEVEAVATAPMHLLRLPRMVSDEGITRTMKIMWNVLRNPAARRRVQDMRSTFKRYESSLGAVMVLARKPLPAA